MSYLTLTLRDLDWGAHFKAEMSTSLTDVNIGLRGKEFHVWKQDTFGKEANEILLSLFFENWLTRPDDRANNQV